MDFTKGRSRWDPTSGSRSEVGMGSQRGPVLQGRPGFTRATALTSLQEGRMSFPSSNGSRFWRTRNRGRANGRFLHLGTSRKWPLSPDAPLVKSIWRSNGVPKNVSPQPRGWFIRDCAVFLPQQTHRSDSNKGRIRQETLTLTCRRVLHVSNHSVTRTISLSIFRFIALRIFRFIKLFRYVPFRPGRYLYTRRQMNPPPRPPGSMLKMMDLLRRNGFRRQTSRARKLG